ncbi:MAG: nucleoside deaminase [Clostridiaceae bacterium]|jgi:tRNA(adenine34) deaminase|nr:nucleoside deaminase [Clostridiaceae bacterium]
MNIDFMRLAIEQAREAAKNDEVPVGAVIVMGNEIIGIGQNRKEASKCAVHHAEIEAIEAACTRLDNWHLDGADIYVTLEPCAMCAGAIINSRIRHIYFGAYDKKAGCCGTLYNLPSDKRFNHRPGVEGGILAEECAALLSAFFGGKRR